jgi:hypothetical protein
MGKKMTKAFHDKIKRDVKKAHPKYSQERVEQETNAIMANIGKGQAKKSSSKGWSGPKGKKGGARKK